MTTMIKFGDIIRNKRLEKGYYQIGVQKITGIERATISNYELNKTRPSISATKKLCELFLLDFEEMLKLIHGDDFELTYGKLFKLRRQELGLTQIEVCEKLNISRTTLESYEGDKRIPREYMSRICKLYGFNEEELLITMNNLDDFSTFGGILKYERMKRYLSIHELSNILNIADSAINSYESNSSKPCLENLSKICTYFNLDYDKFLDLIYPINDDTLGDLLKSTRARLGLSQLEVANKVGMVENSIYFFENNMQKPGYKSLKTLCNFYDLDFIEVNSKYLNINLESDSLGFKLREMRINKNLSQRKVGELLGVSKTIIGFYENNKCKPKDDFLNKMYELYK